MTLAEIRTAVRTLIKEESSETGALFDSTNVKLDYMINAATSLVQFDLIHFMQDALLVSEAVSLIAGTRAYTLTATPLRHFGLYKNVTDNRPRLIREYKMFEIPGKVVVGETAEHPSGWYLSGEKTINFLEIPTTAKTSYAYLWYVPSEPATMAAGGPTYLPEWTHQLIPLKAAGVISSMNDQNPSQFMLLYAELLNNVRLTYAARNQGQPRTLLPDFEANAVPGGELDPAFYDIHSIL